MSFIKARKMFIIAAILMMVLTIANPAYAADDTYMDFEELSANEVLGMDYRIETVDRDSDLTVLAIHGGGIEVGTSQLAKAVADLGDYNYYSFRGLLKSGNSILHITSTRFNEPQAVDLQSRSAQTISIHGYSGSEQVTYLGGLDTELGREIQKSLTAAGFTVKPAPVGIGGTDPDNIANRNLNGQGVQLEITRGLRDRFLTSENSANGVLSRYAKAVHQGVNNYRSQSSDTELPLELAL